MCIPPQNRRKLMKYVKSAATFSKGLLERISAFFKLLLHVAQRFTNTQAPLFLGALLVRALAAIPQIEALLALIA